MKRVFLIVLDSFGIGAMPDSESFGDVGVNTLRACASSGELQLAGGSAGGQGVYTPVTKGFAVGHLTDAAGIQYN